MKKRLSAALIAGTVAVSGIICLSACVNSVAIPKGEEVTKAVWEKALSTENLESLKNYTINASATADAAVKGSVTYGKLTENVSADSHLSLTQLKLYDEVNDKAYEEYNTVTKLKAVSDDENLNVLQSATNKNYYELSEKKDDIKTYWNAGYSKEEQQISNYGKEYEENYWRASETTSFIYNDFVSFFDETFYDKAEDTANEPRKSGKITEFYDSFTYSGGYYSATLYMEADIYDELNLSDVIECKVTLSFKDRNIIGYKIEFDANGNLSNDKKDSVNYNFEYKIKGKTAVAVSDLNKTDPAKIINSDIKKAIDKAKADKAKFEENS